MSIWLSLQPVHQGFVTLNRWKRLQGQNTETENLQPLKSLIGIEK